MVGDVSTGNWFFDEAAKKINKRSQERFGVVGWEGGVSWMNALSNGSVSFVLDPGFLDAGKGGGREGGLFNAARPVRML